MNTYSVRSCGVSERGYRGVGRIIADRTSIVFGISGFRTGRRMSVVMNERMPRSGDEDKSRVVAVNTISI